MKIEQCVIENLGNGRFAITERIELECDPIAVEDGLQTVRVTAASGAFKVGDEIAVPSLHIEALQKQADELVAKAEQAEEVAALDRAAGEGMTPAQGDAPEAL